MYKIIVLQAVKNQWLWITNSHQHPFKPIIPRTDLSFPLKRDGRRHFGGRSFKKFYKDRIPAPFFPWTSPVFIAPNISTVSCYLDPPKCQTCVSLSYADDEASVDNMSVSDATGFSKGSSTSTSWIVHCVAWGSDFWNRMGEWWFPPP